jgi:beta-xylosidase
MLGGVQRRPVHDGDFPDPFVLVAGDRYFAYGTQTKGLNLQVMESADLSGWEHRGDVLPGLPGWAAPGRTWAPSVLRRPGSYVLYYTVHFAETGRQAVSVATAQGPAGPFVDRSTGRSAAGRPHRPHICRPLLVAHRHRGPSNRPFTHSNACPGSVLRGF